MATKKAQKGSGASGGSGAVAAAGAAGPVAAASTITRTVRQEVNSVFLDVTNEEFLVYKVTVKGGTPLFTLVDSVNGKLLLSSKDTPTPPNSGTYQREWPKASDNVVTISSHTLGMHFLAAVKYTYVVEHRFRTGSGSSLLATVIDIDYESQVPTDWYFQVLGVTTV